MRNEGRLGKSEARARFLTLVETVATGGGPVEITDRGKVAAVLLSHNEYMWLLAMASKRPKTRRSLVGSMVLVADLEEASKQLSDMMIQSIHRRAAEL